MHRFAAVGTMTVISLLLFVNSTQIAAQTRSIYRLPAGTRIKLKVDVEVNSNVASVDDTFLAMVAVPLKVRDTVMLPAGTVLEGRVTNAARAAAGGRDGKLDVVFESLLVSGQIRSIEGVMIKKPAARSSRTFRLLSILGGAAAGAIIGGSARSANGALIGAGVGGAAGTGIAVIRKGNDVKIPRDTEFEIELRTEVVLPVLDY